MKKIYAYLLVALIFTVIASAQPPSWVQEKQAQKGGENEAKVIYEQKNGVDWEFVGALVAIFAGTAAVIGWLLSRRERGTTAKYLKEIHRTFNEYKSNASKCETALYSIKEKIEKDFAQGKIKDSAFSILDARLEKHLAEVRKDVVSSQFKLGKDAKKEIDSMLEDGVISEEEYRKFSKMKLDELSAKDKQKLKSLMGKWKSKKE